MAELKVNPASYPVSSLKQVVVSGTVQAGGSGVVRRIKIFKNDYETVIGRTWSAPDGSFSVTVFAGAQDRIGVISIGVDDDENSVIFDKVRP